MLNDRIRQLIQEKFQAEIRYSQQCEVLSIAIEEATGHRLGTTTLKRMMGFVEGSDNPRPSSLDIIAKYLGYPDYKMMTADLGDDSEISEFRPMDYIDSADLEVGEQIKITYHPKRVLVLSYLGDNLYLVNESVGSKLRKGDKITVSGFYVGFELLVSDVERDGKHLGPYQGGRQGGMTTLELL